jgi:type IV pilus assembly protein PilV
MNARNQTGFSMIEVLITIAILMVGLLGLAGLQTRVATAEFEAYQRAQALVIIQDILERMSANKKNLAAYVQNDIAATGATIACVGKTGAALDLCEVNNELVGAAETAGGAKLGAMIGARACIINPAPSSYIVTVAWQGVTQTKAPDAVCGANAYGLDTFRRTVSMPVRLGCLTCP